ncbi:hypothetical protein LJC26_06390 [Desulfovibrio sp. OttesenSCG-928-O18]|nr:hypothetical protein [Desulfovibrio sp. OttesenSCG-928-O18]
MELVVILSAGLVAVLICMRLTPKKKRRGQRGAATKPAGPSTEGVPDYVRELDGGPKPREKWLPEWYEALRAYLGREYTPEEEAAYRAVFGDNSQCGWKIEMYGKVVAAGTNCVLAPANHFLRPLFDKFVKMNIMSTGYAIPPKMILPALSMDELRRMAEQIGAVRVGGKQTLMDAISRFPEADVSSAFDTLNIKRGDLFLADLSNLEAHVRSRVNFVQSGTQSAPAEPMEAMLPPIEGPLI